MFRSLRISHVEFRLPGSEKLGPSRNGRLERNCPVTPIFRNFRPTSRGKPKISEWNSGKCLFHSLPNPEFPEFLVEWKASFVSLFHQADFVSWKGILWAFLGEGPQEKSSLNSSPLVYCLLVKLKAVKRPIWIQTDVYRVRSIAAFKLLSTGK